MRRHTRSVPGLPTECVSRVLGDRAFGRGPNVRSPAPRPMHRERRVCNRSHSSVVKDDDLGAVDPRSDPGAGFYHRAAHGPHGWTSHVWSQRVHERTPHVRPPHDPDCTLLEPARSQPHTCGAHTIPTAHMWSPHDPSRTLVEPARSRLHTFGTRTIPIAYAYTPHVRLNLRATERAVRGGPTARSDARRAATTRSDNKRAACPRAHHRRAARPHVCSAHAGMPHDRKPNARSPGVRSAHEGKPNEWKRDDRAVATFVFRTLGSRMRGVRSCGRGTSGVQTSGRHTGGGHTQSSVGVSGDRTWAAPTGCVVRANRSCGRRAHVWPAPHVCPRNVTHVWSIRHYLARLLFCDPKPTHKVSRALL